VTTAAAKQRHRAGTTAMFVGTVVSAIGAYLFQVIGGRALGAEAFAPVSVMWTVLFLGFTVFVLPVEQMVIRRLVLRHGSPRPLAGAGRVIGAVIGTATLVAVGFAVLANESLLNGDRGYIPVGGVMFIVYGIFAVARGHLAGSHRFLEYGVVVGLDAIGKVVGAAVVALAGWGPVALTWALIVSPLVVLAVRPFRRVTAAGTAPGLPPDAETGFIGGFLVANAASQTVLAAGPLVVGALGSSAGAVSVFFVTTTLFRGPMSASYNLIARVLPVATRRAAAGEDSVLDRWVARLLLGGLGVGAVVGAAGALFGPAVVSALYGLEFKPDAGLAGLAAAGVIAGMAGLATTQILVARGHTPLMAVVWLIALAVAALTVVLVHGSPSTRVAAAFCVSETAALAGLSVAALRRRPQPG
jgi:O-antigen/teichoic acid export membrane protein